MDKEIEQEPQSLDFNSNKNPSGAEGGLLQPANLPLQSPNINLVDPHISNHMVGKLVIEDGGVPYQLPYTKSYVLSQDFDQPENAYAGPNPEVSLMGAKGGNDSSGSSGESSEAEGTN